MKNIRVLVFPCGSEIGLELHESFKDVRFVELIGASSVHDHGACVYANYIEGLPYLNDPTFDCELKSLIASNDIDIVFPALDDAIVKLSSIAYELPCVVVAPNERTTQICRNKNETYELFADCWFNPKTFGNVAEVDEYPVAIKPSVGQGSQGFKVVESAQELAFELENADVPLAVCEYLPGEEYTIDCFTDRFGKLRYCSQRTRGRTKAGISVNSHLTEPDEVVREIAEVINERLAFRGVWFFQLKRNKEGQYRLLEIAPRVAGTMCLERAVGVNLPLLTVFDAFDYDVDVSQQLKSCEVDRSLANVFNADVKYDSVYIDFDDTLVRDGKVVMKTIRFIYQCVNKAIPIILLSRHAKDIHESLRKACLSELLFEQILVIEDGVAKSDCIDKSRNPIFIDDSFAERKDVHDTLGILTFGPDNLEVLIDCRE